MQESFIFLACCNINKGFIFKYLKAPPIPALFAINTLDLSCILELSNKMAPPLLLSIKKIYNKFNIKNLNKNLYYPSALLLEKVDSCISDSLPPESIM